MTDAAHKAFSFAACEAIRSGAWDEHLHLIYSQIKVRQATEEYRRSRLSVAEFRAGQMHMVWDEASLQNVACFCTDGMHR